MRNLFLVLTILVNNVNAQVTDYFKTSSTPTENPREIKESTFFYKNSNYRIVSQLNGIEFKKDVFFTNINFYFTANFSTSTFKGDAVFTNSKFGDNVDFSAVTFNKDVTFSSCKFNKFLFMAGIVTDTATVFYFYKATLPDVIDFSHNKIIHKVVDFTDADFVSPLRKKKIWSDSRHFINIFDSDINKLKLDYLHFRLCFYDPQQKDEILEPYFDTLKNNYTKRSILKNGDTLVVMNEVAVYNTLIKNGDYKKYISELFPSTSMDNPLVINFTHFYIGLGKFPARLSNDQTEALYSRLLKNFESNGQKMSYESLDVDRNNFVHGYVNIPHFWNRYGYNNEWIFYWTAFFLTVFTLINFKYYERFFEQTNRNNALYELPKIPKLPVNKKYHKLNKLKYAFIYTSLIFFSFSLKTENLNFKKPSFFYVVIINVIGLLCLGYLANFILQK